ncbi:hypothetical protein HHI36_019499 [Cryptolaemus montrouzieri]|uniref:Uncharacterized protein n=1 Tax=Cryptolaemus montrouzieri TaxID=559131 RepID=A0ABD2P466_9CUCU
MEKKNKNKSAYKNPSDLFRRTKSRLALQKFLENLRDQERGYSKGDKQITQCVFLGALRLKPVPDIFQVTLQPISFSTQSNNSVLYNGKTVNKREKAVKNKKTELVKIDEKSLENKTSSIKTNLFINQKPRNRILELFSSNISPKVSVPKKPKVTLKLNTKRKNENKFKYKIKLKGILNRNKKDIVQKVDKATIKNRTAKKEQGKSVKEKTKSKNCEKKSKQDNKPVPIGQKKCESENRDRNLTIKTLFHL